MKAKRLKKRKVGSKRSVEQTLEPMGKNRQKPTVPSELAGDCEALIYQRHW